MQANCMIHTWSLDWPRRECGTPPGSAAAWWTCKHLLQGSDSWCSAVDGCRPVCQWTPHPPDHYPLAAIYKSENEAYKYIMRKYIISTQYQLQYKKVNFG